jgi:hypothetical protein
MFMTTLTPQQKRVLNTIKVFRAEYQEGVPYNILKLDLDIPEEDLTAILDFLEGENYISRQNGIIILKTDTQRQKGEDTSQETQSEETSKETMTVDNNIPQSHIMGATDKDEVNKPDESDGADTGDYGNSEGIEDLDAEIKDQLSDIEQQSLDIITKLVDDSGNISRTLLEGTLLYGELKLNSIPMYNLITSLENKGILKKIKLTDGEYYHFTPELWL